jgi:hypothetical protein
VAVRPIEVVEEEVVTVVVVVAVGIGGRGRGDPRKVLRGHTDLYT